MYGGAAVDPFLSTHRPPADVVDDDDYGQEKERVDFVSDL